MDARVERLDPAAEHLGHLGQRLDARDLEARVLERRRGAAARDELDAELREPAREVLEPVLAVDGEQRAHQAISSRTTSGSRRCSTACTRARSESDVSPGQDRHRLGADHGARVDALVDVVDGRGGLRHARGQDVLDRVRAREGGQRRRVRVDDPARRSGRGTTGAGGACSRRTRPGRRRAPRATPPSRRRAPRGRDSRRARRRRWRSRRARRGRARARPRGSTRPRRSAGARR